SSGLLKIGMTRTRAAVLTAGLLTELVVLSALGDVAQTVAPKDGTALREDETNLPVVFLEAKGQIASEARVPCAVKILSSKRSEPGTTGALPGVVKFHGATSQAYAKKSFALTLDAPVSWQGMRTNAHWILNAAYIDRSLMRHKVSYDLFRSLST